MRPTTGVFQLKGQAPARISPRSLSHPIFLVLSSLSLASLAKDGLALLARASGFACCSLY
jgi:hypothetical protein